ncbi:MAG: hypothetical protein JST39_12760, partial [Bacteroidetes bacterium]|nr:hypothetical protein [Bacteroidota bacterium]
MAITTSQYERISRFLDAAMDADEMEKFGAEVAADPEMAAQLDFELKVRDGFAVMKNDKAGQFSMELGYQPQPGPKDGTIVPKVISLRKWLTAAVAAAAVLGLAVIVLLNRQPAYNKTAADKKANDTSHDTTTKLPVATLVSPKDSSTAADESALFKKYFKKDRLPENYPVFLADALTRYEAGDYTALQKLDLANIPETRGGDALDNKVQVLELGHYYKGISYMETGDAT